MGENKRNERDIFITCVDTFKNCEKSRYILVDMDFFSFIIVLMESTKIVEKASDGICNKTLQEIPRKCTVIFFQCRLIRSNRISKY